MKKLVKVRSMTDRRKKYTLLVVNGRVKSCSCWPWIKNRPAVGCKHMIAYRKAAA